MARKKHTKVVVIPSDRASQKRLLAFVERIERLETEKAAIGVDVKDVYIEVTSAGYDGAIVRQLVKLRKLDPAKRDESAMLLETYCNAVGLDFNTTPLGAAMSGSSGRKAAE